jgi:hypothetical protein
MNVVEKWFVCDAFKRRKFVAAKFELYDDDWSRAGCHNARGLPHISFELAVGRRSVVLF